MTGLLVSQSWLDRYEGQLLLAASAAGVTFEYIIAPDEPTARVAAEDVERIAVAFFSKDLNPELARAFFSAVQGAANLRWLQVYNTGVDAPVYQRLIAKGVKVTTSSGSTAWPVALNAITGMLVLARGFRRWIDHQRDHIWEKTAADEPPADIAGQTLVVFGLGPIGLEISRLAKALGLHVIGVRRSGPRKGEPVDEVRHPSELREVLPRADWLAIAAPLTPETRQAIGAEEIALLPLGARVLNIARGEIIDEAALATALDSGRLGGAYLDVFETEPLPSESPLWDLPTVVISPHDAGASSGSEDRIAAIFLDNLARWARSERLVNEVAAAE